ncbi:MAG: invasion associated locus B family protein [Rhizobiaceae bacterium]|nr:invasion associated locus B family protein [Rhizobiaceae bacterium]MCV0405794.1 invasion associated locus B family protein [Rhizobiaceae bacterium]
MTGMAGAPSGAQRGTPAFSSRLFAGAAVAAALAFLMPGAALTPPAWAQETAQQPSQGQAQQPAQPWQVGCASAGSNEPLVCRMTQTLVARESGQRVLAAAIVKKPDGGYRLTLGLPHGLHLPSGINIWVDEGEKAQYPIETADQNGSYSSIDLASRQLDAMRRGQVLNVSVTSANQDEVILQLSLTGFSASVNKI